MSFEVKSSVTITTVIKQGEVPVDLTEKQRIFYKNYEPMEGTFVPQWSSWLLSLSQFYHDLHNDHDGSQVSTLPVSLAASLSSSASSSSTNQSSSQCGRSARYFSQIYFMFYLFCKGRLRMENTPANRSEATGSICQSAKDLECIPLQTIMHHSEMCGDGDGEEEEEEEMFYVDETGAYVFTILAAHLPCSCPHVWVDIKDAMLVISMWVRCGKQEKIKLFKNRASACWPQP